MSLPSTSETLVHARRFPSTMISSTSRRRHPSRAQRASAIVRASASASPARGSDYAAAAATFVSSFFYDGDVDTSDGEFRALVGACASDMRRRYGSTNSLRVIVDDEGCLACGGIEVRKYVGAMDYESYVRSSKGGEDVEARVVERPVVANLATARRARRKGYGKAIMRSLEELCAERGFDECVLVVEARNTRAQGFYKKLGYKVIGSESKAKALEVGPDGRSRETFLKTLVMRKSLTNSLENVDPVTIAAVLTLVFAAIQGSDALLDALYVNFGIDLGI